MLPSFLEKRHADPVLNIVQQNLFLWSFMPWMRHACHPHCIRGELVPFDMPAQCRVSGRFSTHPQGILCPGRRWQPPSRNPSAILDHCSPAASDSGLAGYPVLAQQRPWRWFRGIGVPRFSCLASACPMKHAARPRRLPDAHPSRPTSPASKALWTSASSSMADVSSGRVFDRRRHVWRRVVNRLDVYAFDRPDVAGLHGPNDSSLPA